MSMDSSYVCRASNLQPPLILPLLFNSAVLRVTLTIRDSLCPQGAQTLAVDTEPVHTATKARRGSTS